MDQFSIKFQIFQSICMSNLDVKTPQDMQEATALMFDYITKGMTFEEDRKGNVFEIVQ